MISFPNAKINIGLRVLEKRPDGYHNIESVFYPVGLCDALEIIHKAEQSTLYGNKGIELNIKGLEIPGDDNNNLCVKAYNLLKNNYKLPPLKVWLLKCIPMGAGLGGGSSDAAFLLKLINEYCSQPQTPKGASKSSSASTQSPFRGLGLANEELKALASQIGSDCTFFIENKPSLVTGKGETITPINIDLSGYYISIVCPNIHVNTQKAYSLITPQTSPPTPLQMERGEGVRLEELILKHDISHWKDLIRNDFEVPVFNLYPQLAEIKETLYAHNALYASMTGSGSAIYGIFKNKPNFGDVFSEYKVWGSKL